MIVVQINIFVIFKLVRTSVIICKLRGCLKIIIFAHSMYFGFLKILENLIFSFRNYFRAPKFNKMIKRVKWRFSHSTDRKLSIGSSNSKSCQSHHYTLKNFHSGH